MFKPQISAIILLLLIAAASCSRRSTSARALSPSATDSITDPVAAHRALTDSVTNERSLYRAYRIASDNAAFFSDNHNP